MREEEWRVFFNNISNQLTVSWLARPPHNQDTTGYLEVESSLPVFDAIDLLEKHEGLILPDGRVVVRKLVLKRPTRILFFVLLTELESKLYRTQEWSNRQLNELNEFNLNALITDLLNDQRLFSYQKIYDTRASFKEDLKAVSAMRNHVVHVNKKLELEVEFDTIVTRKRQLQKLIKALSEILDEQGKGEKRCEQWSREEIIGNIG